VDKAPVLVIAFNRPGLAAQVFDVLRVAKPDKLFFAVDGPRVGNTEDAELVQAVRSLVSGIGWDCEVRTLFPATNLGCKVAVSQAISWFFEYVEAGIILEDDCVPHLSFFPFSEELLIRFRHDERVMMISGDNFQEGAPQTSHSYYFSRYTHTWGWATWRRAWRLYDHGMKAWPERRNTGWLRDVLGDAGAVRYWGKIFEETWLEKNSAWDYRWIFSAWVNNGLTVLPSVNLVSNIGFGAAATNTQIHDRSIAALEVSEMGFPLSHPDFVVRNARADAFMQRKVFRTPAYWRILAHRLRQSILGRE
jgi:hypothetical protein